MTNSDDKFERELEAADERWWRESGDKGSGFTVGARWGYERGKDEHKNIADVAKRMNGFAACNLAEPSKGDLERVYKAYQETWSELAAAREEIERLTAARDAYANAMEIAMREGIFVEKSRVKNEIYAVLGVAREREEGE